MANVTLTRFTSPARLPRKQGSVPSWAQPEVLTSRPGERRLSPGIRRCPVPLSWGSCRFPVLKVLAVPAGFGHIWGRSSIPGGRCSQGGVKIPTGGKGDVAQARERLLRMQIACDEGSADSV